MLTAVSHCTGHLNRNRVVSFEMFALNPKGSLLEARVHRQDSRRGFIPAPSPPAQMRPQLFAVGTFRCKYNVGPSKLISVAILVAPLSRRERSGWNSDTAVSRLGAHCTLKKLKRKEKVLIAFPPPTEPISYGLSSGSLLFSENQPNGTPYPSPLWSSLRNSQCTTQGSVFPGLGFAL